MYNLQIFGIIWMIFNIINEQNTFGNHAWHILMTHLTYLDL